MQEYDVIIIGAGLAGLMAARELKDSKYLVIDSKKEIGLPLKCGEGIKKRDLDEVTDEKSFVKGIVKEHVLALGEHRRTLNIEYYKLDRPEFEKWLGKDVNLKLDCQCKDVIIKDDHALVITDDETYKSKLVILAYGAYYHVQEKYGLIDKKPEQLICYGGIFNNCKVDPNKFIFYSEDNVMGGFWIFPNDENEVNIGFGSFKGNVKQICYDLMKKFPELRDAKLVSEFGGIVPCSGAIKKTYHERLLVCGNAAGHVYGGSGEGISYALHGGKIAGKIASEALKNNRFDEVFLSRFEERWKKKFGQELIGGKICIDLLKIAYKYNLGEKVFYHPKSSELFNIVDKGEFPLRARFFWKFATIFNMENNYEQRKKIPFMFMVIYKLTKPILRLFS
jgi:digeranylgeranylglycerophospholipid reductase